MPPYYDSLLAKVIVHGKDRGRRWTLCCGRCTSSRCEGITTTIPFHRQLLQHPVFRSGDYHLDFLEKYMGPDGTFDAESLEWQSSSG